VGVVRSVCAVCEAVGSVVRVWRSGGKAIPPAGVVCGAVGGR